METQITIKILKKNVIFNIIDNGSGLHLTDSKTDGILLTLHKTKYGQWFTYYSRAEISYFLDELKVLMIKEYQKYQKLNKVIK